MRLLPFIASAIVTVSLVTVLNVQLPIGKSKSPKLGYFLSPQQGFWKNAEKVNANFDAQILAKDLKGKVDVYMDDRLVPHIYAENDEDAYFVQGYLHAQFRLWQMDFQTRVAAGRLSEIAGADKLSIDKFFRRLGMVYGAEQTEQMINETNPVMKATVDAYTAGVNAYLKQLSPENIPFEYKLMNYQPEEWTPKKTYLFLMFMSYDLTGRSATADLQLTNTRDYLGFDLFDKLYTNQQDSLDPIIPKGTEFAKASLHPVAPTNADFAYLHKKDSTVMATNSSDAPEAPDKNNGSNNWAVAGSKTKSGRPILCSDPHLGLNLPSLWYEVQITTPTHSTYGASFPGSPAVIIGFNDSLAWGVTNAGRDVLDYYELKFKDSTQNEYWYNGAWKATTKRTEVIKVKDSADVVEEIAMTHWGDELAGSPIPLTKPEAYVLVEQMIKDTNFSVADDIRTANKIESLKDQVILGIENATIKLAQLEKENKLSWSAFKATRVMHLTKTDALSRLNLPIGGGVNIINATTEAHGPSWRMVVHLTDEIEAYGLYPGGQSGNPGSPPGWHRRFQKQKSNASCRSR